jgi:hypothetical protein
MAGQVQQSSRSASTTQRMIAPDGGATVQVPTDDLRATVDLHRLASDTHSPECWQWHRDCALLMACDEIDRLITEGNRLCDAVRGITMGFMDQRLRVALNEACDQWESR